MNLSSAAGSTPRDYGIAGAPASKPRRSVRGHVGNRRGNAAQDDFDLTVRPDRHGADVPHPEPGAGRREPRDVRRDEVRARGDPVERERAVRVRLDRPPALEHRGIRNDRRALFLGLEKARLVLLVRDRAEDGRRVPGRGIEVHRPPGARDQIPVPLARERSPPDARLASPGTRRGVTGRGSGLHVDGMRRARGRSERHRTGQDNRSKRSAHEPPRTNIAVESDGAPSRSRTRNLLIRSQTL